MRRLLAVTLLAAPLAAAAQTLPSPGEIDFSADSTISVAECSSTTATVGLTWQIKPDTAFVTGGTVDVYASNQVFGSDADPYCYTAPDSGTGRLVALLAEDVAAIEQTATTALPVKTSTIASVTTLSACEPNTGQVTVYVCLQWFDPLNGLDGFARGTMTLELDGPDAPTVSSVTAGEEALNVTIAPAATGIVADEFRAVAVADPAFPEGVALDPDPHRSTRSSRTDPRIEGLVNGVRYLVTAFAYSEIGNESLESAPWGVSVAPRPVEDAREYYELAGGRDDGGCQAGGAGLAALLGAAALLALRRRRP